MLPRGRRLRHGDLRSGHLGRRQRDLRWSSQKVDRICLPESCGVGGGASRDLAPGGEGTEAPVRVRSPGCKVLHRETVAADGRAGRPLGTGDRRGRLLKRKVAWPAAGAELWVCLRRSGHSPAHSAGMGGRPTAAPPCGPQLPVLLPRARSATFATSGGRFAAECRVATGDWIRPAHQRRSVAVLLGLRVRC